MPPKLGLDELRNISDAITPDYRRRTRVEHKDLELEPVLSKDNRNTLCSLSLTCKALRLGAQRALLRYISITEYGLPRIYDFFTSDPRYRDKFPVRKLRVEGNGFEDTPKNLIKLLKRCSELEFLSLEGCFLPRDGWDWSSAPDAFSNLVTLRHRAIRVDHPSHFGSMIASMPRLRNLITGPAQIQQDLPLMPVEMLVLEGLSAPAAQVILNNSFQSLHTLHLSDLGVGDDQNLMDTLEALLDSAGSCLCALHISCNYFRPQSIASLVRACPKLEALGIVFFKPDEVFPLAVFEGGGEDHPAALGEQGGVQPGNICATMLIINALCAPLLRLHIFWRSRYDNSLPVDGYRLPTLCVALRGNHEKLARLELISLEVREEAEVGNQYFNLDPEEGIVAVCKERGLRLRYSTETSFIEWGPR